MEQDISKNDDLGNKLWKINLKNVLSNFFGGVDKASLQAIEIGKILKEVCDGNEPKMIPVVSGYSHGGGLAQCAAAANGIKGEVFLSRPMGASLRRYIGIDKINKNASQITAFSMHREFLSGTRILNVLSVWVERLFGIPMPRTVAGHAYQLPDPSRGKGSGFYLHQQMLEALKLINPTYIDIMNAIREKEKTDD